MKKSKKKHMCIYGARKYRLDFSLGFMNTRDMVIATTSTFSNLTRKDVEETRKFVREERRRIRKMTQDEARRYLVEIGAVKPEEAKRLGWNVRTGKRDKAAK